MHRYQRIVQPSKQFWNWFCGMTFRAAVVLLLTSSVQVCITLPAIYKGVSFNWPRTWSNSKVHELIAVKVLHTSALNATAVACKVLPLGNYAPMPAPSQPSKQFWNWFCGMAFRADVVLLLTSSMSSKCLPFDIPFIFGNRKCHWGVRSDEQAGCSNTVICLVAKNLPHRQCLVSRSIVVTQDPRVVGKMFGSFPSNFFTQAFPRISRTTYLTTQHNWHTSVMYFLYTWQ